MPVKTWVVVYLVTFIVLEGLLLVTFKGFGGENRVMTKMLMQAETLREQGRYNEALEVLDEYGRRWPGAHGTRNFEQRLGDYYFDAEQYETAARHYERSIAADQQWWDTRALAGRAHWMAGNREKAVEHFKAELESGNPESGLANYHLGLWQIEQGNLVEAMQHIQSIRDREQYSDELAAVRKRIEDEVLKPAREHAASGNS